MKEKYRYFDHTADVAFEAYGETPGEVFANAALAVFETMVDLKTVSPHKEYSITLSAPDEEQLLFDFLSELVFVKDAEYVVFNEFDVIIRKNDEFHLVALAHGETIDPGRHELRVDVKAVTLHRFSLREEGGKYKASVILDI